MKYFIIVTVLLVLPMFSSLREIKNLSATKNVCRSPACGCRGSGCDSDCKGSAHCNGH